MCTVKLQYTKHVAKYIKTWICQHNIFLYQPFKYYECVRLSALKYCQYHTGHLLSFQKQPIWSFCQNNTVMLTYTHNHAAGILLWECSYHRNGKQNSEPFFNFDANLSSVIAMELKFVFFLCVVGLYVWCH